MTDLGDYTIEEELGRGAMGVVYLARHRPTGSLRAVKLLHEAADPTRVERFRREAEALARVGGGAVVPIHEVGVAKGRAFFAMAAMAGGSLRDRLTAKPRLDWREAATLGVALARALESCHAARIIHRDLKPENILFDTHAGAEHGAGAPRLADFGIARDLDARSLTKTGALVGSLAYMAPELLGGQKADARADVYALAVVLHETLAGDLPHEGVTPLDLFTAKATRAAQPLPAEVPAALAAAIERALAPDPSKRPSSASAFAEELESVLVSPDAKPRRSGRRANPFLLGGLGGLAVMAALVVLVVVTGPGAGELPQPGPPPLRGGGGGPGNKTQAPSDTATARRLLDEAARGIASRSPLARILDRVPRARDACAELPADAVAPVVSAIEGRLLRLAEETSLISTGSEIEAVYAEAMTLRELGVSLGATPRLPRELGPLATVYAGNLMKLEPRRVEAVKVAALALELDPALASRAAEVATINPTGSPEGEALVGALLDRALALAPPGLERAIVLSTRFRHLRDLKRWDDLLPAAEAALAEDPGTASPIARIILENLAAGIPFSPAGIAALEARAPRCAELVLACSLLDESRASDTVRAFELGFDIEGVRILALTLLAENTKFLSVIVSRLLAAGRTEDAADMLATSRIEARERLAREVRAARSNEERAAVARRFREAVAR